MCNKNVSRRRICGRDNSSWLLERLRGLHRWHSLTFLPLTRSNTQRSCDLAYVYPYTGCIGAHSCRSNTGNWRAAGSSTGPEYISDKALCQPAWFWPYPITSWQPSGRASCPSILASPSGGSTLLCRPCPTPWSRYKEDTWWHPSPRIYRRGLSLFLWSSSSYAGNIHRTCARARTESP